MQDFEYREGLATQIGAIQKLSEPLVRVVDKDIKKFSFLLVFDTFILLFVLLFFILSSFFVEILSLF